MALFAQVLDRFSPGRLLDLGTGHGIFARLAADKGWNVTAVDARAERFPEDSRVQWIRQDIRTYPVEGFDLVACLGLWYHLALRDQLELATRTSGTPLVIDTHIALTSAWMHGRHRKNLSRLRVINGYTGRLYGEAHLQSRLTASFGNDYSFWPTEASLRDQLFAAGYDSVCALAPQTERDRGFFVAVQIDDQRGLELDSLIAKYIPLDSATSLEVFSDPRRFDALRYGGAGLARRLGWQRRSS
jgi:SAM-dependent methyltransferase